MKKIYISESKLGLLEDADNKVTFYEFLINSKNFLKGLLNKPSEAKLGDLFVKKGYTKDDMIGKMKDLGIVKYDEKIDEVESSEKGKKVSRHMIKYSVPKSRFNDKMHQLYNDLFLKEEGLFRDEDSIISDVRNNDTDGAYSERGGLDEDGGATSCGSAMQGGGTNPSAGQYDVPFYSMQRKGFWKPAIKRNKDEDNGSISINSKK